MGCINSKDNHVVLDDLTAASGKQSPGAIHVPPIVLPNDVPISKARAEGLPKGAIPALQTSTEIVLGSAPASPMNPSRVSSHRRGSGFNGDGRDSGLSVETSSKSRVGADFANIIDDQGMLNTVASRQMSQLSRYSVRSESGSVVITPELGPRAPFQLKKLIGKGGFGNVYLAQMNTGEYVAVKIIQGYNDAEQPDEKNWELRKERMAQMEAVLMSAIEHENIVQTHKVTAHQGAQVDPELSALEKQLLRNYGGSNNKEDSGLPDFEWHITMEYCDKGSLSHALSNFMLHTPKDAQFVQWDAWASLEILKEVTQSLIFLHEERILHGDLKAANVLLKSSDLDRRKYISKVSDFGLSRVLQSNKNHIKTQTFGTVTHVPPELLAKGMLTAKADVYAIGVLMWEIFTSEKVFKQLSDSEVILAVVTRQARPLFPTDVPSRYKFLAERCWSEMMELRPTLPAILAELQKLQDTLCPDGPDSAFITIRVYPSRVKALTENIKRRAAAAQQACGSAPAHTTSAKSVSFANNAPASGSPKTQHTSGRANGSAGGATTSPLRLGSSTGASRSFSNGSSTARVASSSGSRTKTNNASLPMSPLAPTNVGSPARAYGCSMQRPAEKRESATKASNGENGAPNSATVDKIRDAMAADSMTTSRLLSVATP
uniref:Protein kinase domain-containing protein n=1 Tax=Chlamydomonas euryale TaxID=1486919 RepID=A0A7R9V8Z4_9CHLO|mmetsp:Transcript_25380/g.74982  ORF Transcript_25380/g.74982 Transcript_25380/m.74982 type:complete len:660 (+) Transcript_25380:462-2441(+)